MHWPRRRWFGGLGKELGGDVGRVRLVGVKMEIVGLLEGGCWV